METASTQLDLSQCVPCVPPPDCVRAAIEVLLAGDSVTLHGYTTAAGLPSLRKALADALNARYDAGAVPERFYVTCGIAAALAISLRAVLSPGDEVVIPAPFDPDYRVYVEAAGAKIVPVAPAADFQIDPEAFEAALTERTGAVIICSPCNPTGAVLSRASLLSLTGALRRHEEETGRAVYLISDERWIDLTWEESAPECIFNCYDDAILCRSFGETFSVPGEVLGYLAVGGRMAKGDDVYAAIAGAGRSMGYVNPPSLFQRVMERCIGAQADFTLYRENRALLLNVLRQCGAEVCEPQGGVFLWFRSPVPDAADFCARAREKGLLLSPGDGFGAPGYVRACYCVPRETAETAAAALRELLG